MSRFDDFTARMAVRAARRQTRRSFMGQLGRAALVVAGAGIALGRSEQAAFGHHECGHTGFSSNCPNDFCPDVFGRCWYGADCCANGQIKKICDCCSPNFPNVHGYCPAGHNVRCIVTSCGRHPASPRPLLVRVMADNPAATAASLARTVTGGRPVAVLVAEDGDPVDGLAAPGLARSLGANVLTCTAGRIPVESIDEIGRQQVTEIWLTGPPDSVVDGLLAARRLVVHRLSGRTPAERAAAAVYEMARRRVPSLGVVVSVADEPGRWAGLAAASAAAELGAAFVPVPPGPAAPAASALIDAGVTRTVVIGGVDLSGLPAPQVVPLPGDPAAAAAVALRAVMAGADRTPDEWCLASGVPTEMAVALAAAGTKITAVCDGSALSRDSYQVIEDSALSITRMWAVGRAGAVSDPVYMAAEDALKAYDRDQYLPGVGIYIPPG